MSGIAPKQNAFKFKRRKTDVTFAANPEIYYQDFFPT
jgi:hypothetical protein